MRGRFHAVPQYIRDIGVWEFPVMTSGQLGQVGGGTLSAEAAGPSPLASFPWQTAQYSRYIPAPEMGSDEGEFDALLSCFS
jgi:hypothetical protein